MDTRLALTGTPVNFLASIGAGQDLAARQAQMGRTAQEWGLYRQHGEGIASGDQNAINALARFDPTAALGVRQTHQSMRHADERMGLARAAAARAAQSHAASLSAAERAEEGQRLGRAVATLIGPLRAGDLETVNQGLRTLGITDGPLASLDDAAILMAGVETALPYFEAGQAMLGGGEPEITTAMQTLTQRAAAAGLQPGTPEFQQFMLQGGSVDDGMRIVTRPDGTMTFEQGAAVSEEVGDTSFDPSAPALMISNIDGILNHPAFGYATGAGSILQNVPGTEAFGLGTRIAQLDGQAFLQAFDGLRGGGQITEIEGRRATQAIGRLDSAQRPEDYREALLELRSILELGMTRPVGWSENQVSTGSFGEMDAEALLAVDPAILSPEQIQQYNQRLGQVLGSAR